MQITKSVSILAVIAAALFVYSPVSAQEDTDGRKSVLITGATSGIGRAAAERLAADGYIVYAGARSVSDIEKLNKIDGIVAIRLDVTIQKDIDDAVRFIEAEGRGLWGVVNNAGVNVIEPLIEVDESNLDFLFDVNVYGVVRITKAFAPMIIESKGRIVNISSISGVLSGGLPGYGMYTMSKHAIEAYTDQLAFEMDGFGVRVSAIEPGNFGTDIGTSRCKRMIAHSSDREYVYFADVMQEYLDRCKEYIADGGVSSSPPPDLVVDAISHALFDENPKEHYLVVANRFEGMITISKALEELLYLNHGHEFSYTREELIELMDEEWSILKGEKVRSWDDED